MNIKYNDILKDKDLNSIFKNNYFERVYDLLGKFVLRYNLDMQESRDLRNKLFIEYMKNTNLKRKNSHVYERVLIGTLENYVFKDIIIYILNQDIDLNYEVVNRKNMRSPIINILATRVKDKDIMSLLLNKLKDIKIDTFVNNYTNERIDTCQMHIIANNLEIAYKFFNQSNYTLIREDLIRLLKENYQVKLEDFDYMIDDKLYRIILTIKEANIDDIQKKKLLIAILKNKKVKLLNTKSLDIIKEILGPATFNSFLDYLKENDIVLYNISLTDYKVLYLEDIQNIYSKMSVKMMINTSKTIKKVLK